METPAKSQLHSAGQNFYLKFRWFYTPFALFEIYEACQDYHRHQLYWWRLLLVLNAVALSVYIWILFFSRRRYGQEQ